MTSKGAKLARRNTSYRGRFGWYVGAEIAVGSLPNAGRRPSIAGP